jgi:hypothetical protein
MPRMEFEPMIPVFGRAKRVHALDSATIEIGAGNIMDLYEKTGGSELNDSAYHQSLFCS